MQIPTIIATSKVGKQWKLHRKLGILNKNIAGIVGREIARAGMHVW